MNLCRDEKPHAYTILYSVMVYTFNTENKKKYLLHSKKILNNNQFTNKNLPATKLNSKID